MASAVYYAVRQAVLSQVQALNLALGNTTLPVRLRKLPRIGEDLDTVPCILIPGSDRPAERKPLALGPIYRVVYPIEVVFVAAGNQDFFTNLDVYDLWHEQVTSQFATPTILKGLVAQVWDVDVVPGVVVDRAAVSANYDYGGLTVRVTTHE